MENGLGAFKQAGDRLLPLTRRAAVGHHFDSGLYGSDLCFKEFLGWMGDHVPSNQHNPREKEGDENERPEGLKEYVPPGPGLLAQATVPRRQAFAFECDRSKHFTVNACNHNRSTYIA